MKEPEPVEVGACVHHWRLPGQGEAQRPAVCLKCGDERTFAADIESQLSPRYRSGYVEK